MKYESTFWSRVNKAGPLHPTLGPCWAWSGSIDRNGYARMSVHGTYIRVHRFSWELANGPIPQGLQIDHLCRNRPCVNPKHLEPVTQKVNHDRGIWGKGNRTHCINGHEFDEENTYHWHEQRRCRACNLDCTRRYRAA